VQLCLQKLLASDELRRTSRFELFVLGRNIADMLMLFLVLQNLISGSDDLRGRDDFHEFPQLLAEMAHCPAKAVKILEPLFRNIRQVVATSHLHALHSLDMTVQVEAQSSSEAPSLFGGIHAAIHAVRGLLPLEAKYHQVHKGGAGDLQLCMAISEELKPALDNIFWSLVTEDNALHADLRRLSWTASGFHSIPALSRLLQVLGRHLPAWSFPSSAANLVVPRHRQDAETQTEESVGQPLDTSFRQLLSCAQHVVGALADAAAQQNVRRNLATLLRGAAPSPVPAATRFEVPWQEYEFEHDLEALTFEEGHNIHFLELLRLLQFQSEAGERAQVERVLDRMRLLVRRRHRLVRPLRADASRMEVLGTGVFDSHLEEPKEEQTVQDLLWQYVQLLMQWVLHSSDSIFASSNGGSSS
jgi:hypothetical protein